ncbi:uncharacterized protein LOC130669986 isoform X2 [Microplitis mediator]|uniref:uncharacterized protein LOC130669986 isoform X2 n=1 Tax=Microplitis mediator TaxID=375433 RepID=UPI002557506A|nr:uncharacterized protein LOC130669986 isoform X2 [Microplitis mediator]
MKLLFIQLLSTILSVNAVFKPDPTAQIKFEEITLNIPPNNPYIGDMTVEIISPGDIFSVKFSIKKDFPENMKFSFSVEFEEVEVSKFDMFVCEAMDEKVKVKPVLERGLPVGKFPTGCPVKAGNDFEMREFQIQYDSIPPEFPVGTFFTQIVIFEAGKDPYGTANVDWSFYHELSAVTKIPELPKIPEAPGIPGIGR